MHSTDNLAHKHSISVSIPRIRFPSENSIKVANRKVTIAASSRQANVIRFFCSDASRLLPKLAVTKVVHDLSQSHDSIHFRHEEALLKNSTQVLCRLRKRLAQKFNSFMPEGTEWLHYSEKKGGWILYRLPAYGSDGGWH
ncbi:MAG: hypothetical protein NT027_10800 [Proteobacteria bacterium]|nr:hypothetical protein [Pseudomonadota bacterium]